MSDLAASLGMPLDEWQDVALEAAMGERSDGRWASKYVGISAPRQNGKSQLIVARALAGILLFGEKTIIISAHETDTAREVWKRLIDVVEDNPTLEARVTGRMDAINREFLSFGRGKDRQTIKLKARRQSGSRGFSCDCLLLDEAQILGKRQWGSINPTMSARPNPQMWLFGTPPTETDDPFAFSRVRDNGKAKRARHCWLEWAAEPGDDFDDPETWAKANPSFGVRISEEACADDRAAMDDEQFAMERLGIWMDDLELSEPIFGAGAWESCEGDVPSGPAPAVGIAVSIDRAFASFGFSSQDGDALGLRSGRRGQGTNWVLDEAKRLHGESRCEFVVDARGPAANLIPDLEDAGLRVVKVNTTDYTSACSDLFDDVQVGAAVHRADDDELNRAVRVATIRPVGDRWAWGRKGEDISCLEAVTLAAWLARSTNDYDVLDSIF